MWSEYELKFLSNAFDYLAINIPYSCQISVWVNHRKTDGKRKRFERMNTMMVYSDPSKE